MWLETSYVNMLSGRVRNYKRKDSYSWNFSCPICGDSTKDRHKARGYVFRAKDKLLYHCQNCGITKDIPALIKYIDLSMYEQFMRDKFVEDKEKHVKQEDFNDFVQKMKPPVFQKNSPLKELKKVSQLSVTHPVKEYVGKRLIPPEYHHKLFLALRFKEFVNKCIPGKFESVEIDEPRLIIPFLDEEKNLFGFQGRSFNKNDALRYITIMIDDRPKMFGLDTVDINKHIYVVEGPIDSMFLDNGIASAGGNITADLETISKDRNLFTVIYDNEARSIHTVKKIEKAIVAGYRVCIWPAAIKEKDVNDMVMNGMSGEKILDVVMENSYTGLEAQLRLAEWRKC